MGTITKRGASFERELPPSGLHRAVCVDEHDLGFEESGFLDDEGNKKVQEKVLLVWELDPATAGEHSHFKNWYRIQQKYTNNLDERANLYSDLVSWRGIAFTDADLEGFDLGNVLGKPCLINVVHKEDKKGNMWANIGAITPLMANQEPLEPSGKYIRIKDRPAKGGEPARENPPVDAYVPAGEFPDDDLPF